MVSLAPWDFFSLWEGAAVMAQYWTRAALLGTAASCQPCWACLVPECCWDCSYCSVPTQRDLVLAGASTKNCRGYVMLAWGT